MVQIVSGVPKDQFDGGAILRGFGQGQQMRAREQQMQMAQQDQAMQMQALQMKFQQARAEREQLLNQAAQQGDVRALQEMQIKQKLAPSQSMAQDAMQILGGITDPGARDDAMVAVKALIDEQQKQERVQAGHQGIADAFKDGLIDEVGAQNAQQRMQAGEEPETILQEFHAERGKRATSAANTKESQAALAQAAAMVEAAQPGPGRKQAEMLLATFEQSPSLQEKPGSGQRLTQAVQKALTAARDSQIANYVSQRKDMESFARDFSKMKPEEQEKVRARMQRFGPTEPSDEGMGPFQSGPEDPGQNPAMQGHVASQKAEKEKRYPGSTGQRKPSTNLPTVKLKKAKSEEELIDILQAAGVPLDQASVSRATEIWRGG